MRVYMEVASGVSDFCDPMDCSPPGSSVHSILQAKMWSGLACSPPGDLPKQGIKSMSLMSPTLACRFFNTWEAYTVLTY